LAVGKKDVSQVTVGGCVVSAGWGDREGGRGHTVVCRPDPVDLVILGHTERPKLAIEVVAGCDLVGRSWFGGVGARGLEIGVHGRRLAEGGRGRGDSCSCRDAGLVGNGLVGRRGC
jgi:hypothetical protein